MEDMRLIDEIRECVKAVESALGLYESETEPDPKSVAKAKDELKERIHRAVYGKTPTTQLTDHLNVAKLSLKASETAEEGKQLDAFRSKFLANCGVEIEIQRDFSGKPPAQQWLVKNWLPANRLVFLTGQGAVGKSRLALQLAASIANGEPAWLPGGPKLVIEKATTAVFVTWEDELAEVHRRLYTQDKNKEHYSRRPIYDLGDRLHVLGAMGVGPLWAPLDEGSWRLAAPAYWTQTALWVQSYCETYGAILLVIDPLAAAFASDENTRHLVRAFCSSLDAWAQRARCTVLVIAHPPKSTGVAYSGSTDWHAAGRAMWQLSTEPRKPEKPTPTLSKVDTAPCLSLHKGNYTAPQAALWLAGYPAWEAVGWEKALKEYESWRASLPSDGDLDLSDV